MPSSDAPSHEHTQRCWWDLDQARWTCPAPERAPVLLTQALPVEAVTGTLIGASSEGS